MPRILFPFTRAKLNSIARLPWREGKKVMIFTAGMKQRPRYVVPEHQAPVNVLMSLHDLVIPIFAHEITKVNKIILNFHQCFSSKIPKRYTLLKTVWIQQFILWSWYLEYLKGSKREAKKLILKDTISLHQQLKMWYIVTKLFYYIHFNPKMM